MEKLKLTSIFMALFMSIIMLVGCGDSGEIKNAKLTIDNYNQLTTGETTVQETIDIMGDPVEREDAEAYGFSITTIIYSNHKDEEKATIWVVLTYTNLVLTSKTQTGL